MCKSEIFADILVDVSRETEIPSELILSSSKRDEVIDARFILIHLMSLNGFYISEIARCVHVCERAVRYSRSHFHDRLQLSPMMRINLRKLETKWGGGKCSVIILNFIGLCLSFFLSSIGSFVLRLTLTGTTKLLNKWTGLMSSIQTAITAADTLL